MTTQIGAQIYTIRDDLKTPADMAKAFKRLSDIGFTAVQTSALGPIEAPQLRKMLDDHGLTCAATHVSLDEMKDTEKVIDYHQTLGCELTALGAFRGVGVQAWRDFIAEFNPVAKTLAARGLKIGYHNHNHEFVPFNIADDPANIGPQHTPYQMMLNDTDPSVWFELDTYWVQAGGADPAAWIDKVAGRIPALHVKDMTLDQDKQHVMCEVGLGNLNWEAILAAAKRAGVRWYLIERDRGMLDPYESLKISREKLMEMGLQ